MTPPLRLVLLLALAGLSAAPALAQKGASGPAPAVAGDAPVNDFLFASFPVEPSDTTLTGTNNGADVEPDFNPSASCTYQSPANDGDNAVWWRFEIRNAGTVEVSTLGSDFDTILTVLTHNGSGDLVEVACNDDIGGGTQSSVSFAATVQQRAYYVRVTGYQGATGTINVSVSGAAQGSLVGPPGDSVFEFDALFFSRAPALYPDTNVGATEEAPFEEPVASCVSDVVDGRNSVWRAYHAAADGTVTLDYSASGFDTVVSVYTAGLEEVACDDDSGAGATSLVSFPVTAGQDYYVRVVGYFGAEGAILAALSFEPPPTYTVTEPLAGTPLLAGSRTWVRWTGPGVPNTGDAVDVYLRRGAGAPVLVGSGPNRGRLKVTLPAGILTGSDYTFVVRRQADPSVYGASAPVVIYTAGEQFAFSEPDGGETWQRGTTKTIAWTTPPSAPSGTVTVRWYRGSGVLLETYAGETNDGSLAVSVPSNLTTGDFYFTIVSDADPAFFGRSNTFSIQRFEATAPAEGATWAAGSTRTVSWTAGANAGGQLRVSLRSRTSSYIAVVSPFGPYTDYSRTITVPAGAPSGEYEVQYLHRYTPPGGSEARIFVYSNAITVTNPLAPSMPQRHFAAPVRAEGSPETMLVVTGLADGTEVGVFAPMGEGETLLAAGVVEAGEAVFGVPSEIADGDDALSFGPSATLTIRAWVDGREVEIGETAFAAGEVLVVEAGQASATAETAAAFALVGVVPNPTSGAATVRFTLPEAQAVRVTVYDVLGREVATLLDASAPAGASAVAVPSTLNAGVYVVRVSTQGETASARFTVVR